MTKIQFVMATSYLFMSIYFFVNWLRFTLRHPAFSPEDRFLSFVMFCVTVICWPLVIPFSMLKSVSTKKLELGTVFPAIAAILALSLSFYLS